MASNGFVSGGNGVVLRVGCDGVVWGFRACSASRRPTPDALFVPFSSHASADRLARAVAVSLGWRVWVRRACRCSSAFEVKAVIPMGLSASEARTALRGIC